MQLHLTNEKLTVGQLADKYPDFHATPNFALLRHSIALLFRVMSHFNPLHLQQLLCYNIKFYATWHNKRERRPLVSSCSSVRPSVCIELLGPH